jgi:DNA-nicking Smr family endonuclease
VKETDDAPDQAVEIPIDGTLDLHTFDPRDLGDLLPDYFDACLERGIVDVRIVHGKGRGVLRTSVESLLARLPQVASFRRAGAGAGEWGATLVRLRPRDG